MFKLFFSIYFYASKVEKIDKYLAILKNDGQDIYVFESLPVLPSYVNSLQKMLPLLQS